MIMMVLMMSIIHTEIDYQPFHEVVLCLLDVDSVEAQYNIAKILYMAPVIGLYIMLIKLRGYM